MRFIDFFAGAGGMRHGLERAGHRCVGFCEWDKYARQSYKAVFDTEGEWENHDIRTASSMELPEADLWCYGFPCQGISVAGKQKGIGKGAEDEEADERSNLFFQIIRLLQGLSEQDRPEWLLCENVKNLLSIDGGWGMARVLLSLAEAGYDSEWQVFNTKYSYLVGGDIIGAIPQNRERVYIVSHLRNRGGRKVFPIPENGSQNSVELREITQGMSQGYRVYDSQGISCTLASQAGGLGAKTGLYWVGPRAVLTPDREEKRQNGRRMKNEGEPMFTLTAQDRHGVCLPCERPLVKYNADKENFEIRQATKKGYIECEIGGVADLSYPESKLRRGRVQEGGKVTPTITTTSVGLHVFHPELRIRKLTPKECWRLQGWCYREADGTWNDLAFDRAKAAGVSDSQLYKQAGNGCSANITYAIGLALANTEKDVKQ